MNDSMTVIYICVVRRNKQNTYRCSINHVQQNLLHFFYIRYHHLVFFVLQTLVLRRCCLCFVWNEKKHENAM